MQTKTGRSVPVVPSKYSEKAYAFELLRRGYELYVGKLYKKEIDFVALKEGKRLYVQVSYDIRDEGTLKRELSPLLAIHDNYEKILIARTYQPSYEVNGIKVIDPAEWLTEKGVIA